MKAKFPYKKKTKRLGQGIGSGQGKTGGRGQKGQKSRSGAPIRPGFEGGQTPLYRRLPKRGFNQTAFQETVSVVNLDRLEGVDAPSEITPEVFHSLGLVKKGKIKVLGQGELKKPYKITAHYFSQSAKQKIEKAGGQAITI